VTLPGAGPGSGAAEPRYGDPEQVAQAFAHAHASAVHPFDFSLESLRRDVDAYLEAQPWGPGAEAPPYEAHIGLAAYVGQSLARLYGGTWQGRLRVDNPGANFYCWWVSFGVYRFFPDHYIGYRLSNGPVEGSFAQYLDALLPRIRAGTGAAGT
jgi:hypothetical protein